MERDEIDVVQLKVRMQERLRARIEASASEHGLSLSSEIVARVEQSFSAHDHLVAIFGDPLRARRNIAFNAAMKEADDESGPEENNEGSAKLARELLSLYTVRYILNQYEQQILRSGNLEPYVVDGLEAQAANVAKRAILKGDRNLYRDAYPGDLQDYDPREKELAKLARQPKRQSRKRTVSGRQG